MKLLAHRAGFLHRSKAFGLGFRTWDLGGLGSRNRDRGRFGYRYRFKRAFKDSKVSGLRIGLTVWGLFKA